MTGPHVNVWGALSVKFDGSSLQVARRETVCVPHEKQCNSETNGSSTTATPSMIHSNVMQEGSAIPASRYFPQLNGPGQAKPGASTKLNGRLSGGVQLSKFKSRWSVSAQSGSEQSVKMAVTS